MYIYMCVYMCLYECIYDMWLGRCSDLLATLIPEGVMERLREAPPGEMVAGEVLLLVCKAKSPIKSSTCCLLLPRKILS